MPKIYTKSGDEGETALPGGHQVSKDDLQIEATGALDELNANLGLLHDSLTDPATRELVRGVQENLFVIGSRIAAGENPDVDLPDITESDVAALEAEIDALQEILPPLRNFILPGGHPTVSICHVARSVSRRAERRVVSFSKTSPVDGFVLRYLNRLSDYLFILARSIAREMGIEEIVWKRD